MRGRLEAECGGVTFLSPQDLGHFPQEGTRFGHGSGSYAFVCKL